MIKAIIFSSITFFVGIMVGKSFETNKIQKKTARCGTLRIDRSDPDEPERLFLELSVDIPTLTTMDRVIFNVVRKNYITQK